MPDDDANGTFAIRLGLHGRKLRRLMDYLGDQGAPYLDVANNRGWWLLEDEDSGRLTLMTKEEFHETYKIVAPSLSSGFRYVMDIQDYSRMSRFYINVTILFYYSWTLLRTLGYRIRWSLAK